ncbi:hypothetical protein [Microbispora sp. H10885]|uniref:hypothetical protein n=1 Tax=Microbispora sp. H10885 TaxID=2729110 RepID=UPI001C71EF1E|nr:hypothetical protein [Microbispora sp. H10885]
MSSSAVSGGVARTRATSSSKTASPSPGGAGVRKSAIQPRPRAAFSSSAVTGSSAR